MAVVVVVAAAAPVVLTPIPVLTVVIRQQKIKGLFSRKGKRPFAVVMQEEEGIATVSYTHLDVYKRQEQHLEKNFLFETLKVIFQFYTPLPRRF